MKLLVDEMYPPVISERLRMAGHDVVSVLEQAELIGRNDLEIWRFAAAHRRGIVTENAADFLAISKRAGAAGEVSPSLIVTSNHAFPRHPRSFIGRATRALAAFCDAHSDDDTQAGVVHWLRPAT